MTKAKKNAALSFRAGGGRLSSSPSSPPSLSPPPPRPPPRPPPPPRASHPAPSTLSSVVRAGLSKKRSPLSLKNWTVCLLTLDGRDKFTKVVQYLGRLLAWHFAGLAAASSLSASTSIPSSSSSASILPLDPRLRATLYLALSERFRGLYKSIFEARKVFRLGRSVIEMERLSSMGWGDYLAKRMRDTSAGGGGGLKPTYQEGGERHRGATTTVGFVPRSTPEEEDDDEDDSDDDDDDFDEKKVDFASGKQKPSRRRIVPVPPVPPKPPPPTIAPPWKMALSAAKLLGLAGFWACDNASYLTGTGFLDPLATATATTTTGGTILAGGTGTAGASRAERKARFGRWAARSYFFASAAGLVVASSAVLRHRAGPLADARMRLGEALGLKSDGATRKRNAGGNGAGVGFDAGEAMKEARTTLRDAESHHFFLLLMLLKSVCDVTVFANIPGVDLYLRFRGKKNHEGMHCTAGLMSTFATLYNKFPDAE